MISLSLPLEILRRTEMTGGGQICVTRDSLSRLHTYVRTQGSYTHTQHIPPSPPPMQRSPGSKWAQGFVYRRSAQQAGTNKIFGLVKFRRFTWNGKPIKISVSFAPGFVGTVGCCHHSGPVQGIALYTNPERMNGERRRQVQTDIPPNSKVRKLPCGFLYIQIYRSYDTAYPQPIELSPMKRIDDDLKDIPTSSSSLGDLVHKRWIKSGETHISPYA